MIYHYKAYPELAAFLANGPKSAEKTAYTLLDRCGGMDRAEQPDAAWNAHCFGCLFCLFGEPSLRAGLARQGVGAFISSAAGQAFRGRRVTLPAAQTGQTLAGFTAAQGECLSAWAAGTLHHIGSGENRVSREVPVCRAAPEAGVLATCLAAPTQILVLDAKATAEELLADPAYPRHHALCREQLRQAPQPCLYLTLLGGAEPPLPTLAALTALADGQLRFITVAAVWSLCCRYLTEGASAGWDVVLPSIFKDEECRGLISAGKIMRKNGEIRLESV